MRAYNYVRDGNGDEDVRQALALEHAAHKQRRILLGCLLLKPEIDYAAIGRRGGASEAAVLVYETLFWDVRDRLDDPIYIASLVYPQGRQVEFDPDYSRKVDPMYLALRATVNYVIEAAEELLGLRAPDARSTVKHQSQAFAAKILSLANFAARMGFLHQDLPIFRHAFRVLKALRIGNKTEANRAPEINLSIRLSQSFPDVLLSLGSRIEYPTQTVASRMRMEEVTGAVKRAA